MSLSKCITTNNTSYLPIPKEDCLISFKKAKAIYQHLMPLINEYGEDEGIKQYCLKDQATINHIGIMVLIELLYNYFYSWGAKKRFRHYKPIPPENWIEKVQYEIEYPKHNKRYPLSGKHTRLEWQQRKEQYRFRCAYCGTKAQRLTKDHIVPISKGGTDDILNIVPVCKRCNCRKHTTELSIFISHNNLHFQTLFQ